MIFEWLFAFQARSAEKGVLQLGFFRNPWLLVCMVIGLGLQALVVYLPAANRVFQTQPLTAIELAWALLPGVTAVALESVRKSIAPNSSAADSGDSRSRIAEGRPWHKDDTAASALGSIVPGNMKL